MSGKRIPVLMAMWIWLLFLALSLTTPASGQRNIFEEEEEIEEEEETVPAEEGAALAKNVIDNVNKSYYRLPRGISGFKAVYVVEQGGEKIGKVTVSWRRGESAVARFEGDLEDEETKEFLTSYVAEAWEESLLRILGHRNKVASRSGDGYIINDLHLGPDITKDFVEVAEDYRVTRHVMESGDGSMEWNYNVQTHNGQHFVASISWSTFAELADAEVICQLTYKSVGEAKVIKRLKLTHTGALLLLIETVVYDIALDEQAPGKGFKIVAGDATGRREREDIAEREGIAEDEILDFFPEEWDDLSKKLVLEMAEANLDMASMVRHLKSASCSINVTITPPGFRAMRARLFYSWDDKNNDGSITDEEMEIETDYVSDGKIKSFMGGLRSYLEDETTGANLDSMLGSDVSTRRTGDGYVMTVEGKDPSADDTTTLYLTISEDLRVTKVRAKSGDTRATTKFEYKKVGDKWLKARSVEEGSRGEISSTETKSFSYDFSKEVPLLARTSVTTVYHTVGGNYESRQSFTMRNWKIVMRDKPVALGAALTGNVRDRRRDDEGGTAGGGTGTTAKKRKEAISWCLKATKSAQERRYDEAIKGFTKAIELNPKLLMAYTSRAAAYAENGELDRAMDDANKAIELDGKSAEAYMVRGNLYGREKEPDKAFADLNKAIELDPDFAGAYYYRAVVYAQKGRFQQARADAEKCKQLGGKVDPEFMEYLDASEGLEGALDNGEEAWQDALEELLNDMTEGEDIDD